MDDAFIASVMREFSSSLAASKPLLTELMDGDADGYRMRDGSVVEIPRDKLQAVWDACDDSERIRLRLPIYVSTDIAGETSSWKVDGVTEAAVVAKMLGKKVYRDGYLRLYHPDLKDLQRKAGEAVLVIFTP